MALQATNSNSGFTSDRWNHLVNLVSGRYAGINTCLTKTTTLQDSINIVENHLRQYATDFYPQVAQAELNIVLHSWRNIALAQIVFSGSSLDEYSLDIDPDFTLLGAFALAIQAFDKTLTELA